MLPPQKNLYKAVCGRKATLLMFLCKMVKYKNVIYVYVWACLYRSILHSPEKNKTGRFSELKRLILSKMNNKAQFLYKYNEM